jgi:DNA invertase Pin-like site-specific DNA recombinase
MASMQQPLSPPSQPAPDKSRATEYVRMSTEHQQYSTKNQREVIRQYVQQQGLIIVRTYTDVVKSGPWEA